MPRPNRRTILVSTSAALLGAATGADAATDETRDACLRYVAMVDRVFALLEEWGNLESRLADAYPGFVSRPREEKARFPGAHRFAEIESELDDLDIARDKLLPVVLRLRSRTTVAVVAKLMVVERLVMRDEHPEAHKLVADSVKDLGRLLSV